MNRLSKKIIVMGFGYTGLPTASMLATKGHQVLGVDVSEHAVIPFFCQGVRVD